jgi:hypothetical protein
MCGALKDARAAKCRACWRASTTAPPGLLAYPKPVALTPDEWLTRITETARLHGDCLLATVGVLHEGYRRVKGTTIGTRLVHRFVAEQHLGRRLARSEVIDHECHNADMSCPGGFGCLHRQCVRLDHLLVTTIVQNVANARLVERGRYS